MSTVLGEAGIVISQDELDKAKEYAAKIASVGGSLLSNASNLKKLLDQIQPTT